MQNNLQWLRTANCIHTSKKTYTGTSLTIQNTVNAPVEKLSINGASSQTVTIQGKNLFDFTKATLIANKLSFISNGYQLINTYSTSTQISASTFLSSNTTYTCSRIYTGSAPASNGAISLIDTSGNGKPIINVGEVGVGYKTKTFTTPADLTGYKLYIYGSNITNEISTITNIQIELGTVATAYSAFVPDSPSPSYPATITNVVNPKLLVYGKNNYAGGIISASPSGSTIIDNPSARIIYIPCLPNTDYTISKIQSARFQIFETQVLPANGVSIINLVSGSTDVVLTAKTGATAQYLCVYLYISTIDIGITLQTILDSVKIEVGLTSSNITKLTATLRSLPNGVKDKLVIDKTTQTAWIERNVGSVVFNGSESWVKSNCVDGIHTYFLLNSTINSNGQFVQLCNISKNCTNPFNPSSYNLDCFWVHSSSYRLRLITEPTLADFKTWLASNNVTVQYQLATPIIENITYPSVATIQYLTNISKSGLASNITADVLVIGN